MKNVVKVDIYIYIKEKEYENSLIQRIRRFWFYKLLSSYVDIEIII